MYLTINPFFVLVLLMSVSCTPSVDVASLPIEGESASALNDVRRIAFKAEDLGWPTNSYQETEGREELFGFTPVESILIDSTALPNPINPKLGRPSYFDERGATQFIDMYADEATSQAIFIRANQAPPLGTVPPGVTFTPRVENVHTECWAIAAYSGQGTAFNCNYNMQYGRYFTNAKMYIDKEVTTLEDFETLINIIQDRLIEQVNREAGSS